MQKDTQNKFTSTFVPSGRGNARCTADPRFPNGVTFDLAGTRLGCVAELTYPAPECGVWHIKCSDCLVAVGVTAAGRADDPRAVIVPCNKKG